MALDMAKMQEEWLSARVDTPFVYVMECKERVLKRWEKEAIIRNIPHAENYFLNILDWKPVYKSVILGDGEGVIGTVSVEDVDGEQEDERVSTIMDDVLFVPEDDKNKRKDAWVDTMEEEWGAGTELISLKKRNIYGVSLRDFFAQLLDCEKEEKMVNVLEHLRKGVALLKENGWSDFNLKEEDVVVDLFTQNAFIVIPLE